MVEGHFVLEKFLHEESLAHATAAIDGDKLGSAAIVQVFKFLNLLFSSNEVIHLLLIWPQR